MGLGLQLAARTTPVEKKNTKRAISNLLHGTVLLPPPLIDLTAISQETSLPLSRSYHHRLCPATTLFDLGKNSSDCSIGALTRSGLTFTRAAAMQRSRDLRLEPATRHRPTFDIDDQPSVGDLVHLSFIKSMEMAKDKRRQLAHIVLQQRLWANIQLAFRMAQDHEQLAFSPVVTEQFLNSQPVHWQQQTQTQQQQQQPPPRPLDESTSAMATHIPHPANDDADEEEEEGQRPRPRLDSGLGLSTVLRWSISPDVHTAVTTTAAAATAHGTETSSRETQQEARASTMTSSSSSATSSHASSRQPIHPYPSATVAPAAATIGQMGHPFPHTQHHARPRSSSQPCRSSSQPLTLSNSTANTLHLNSSHGTFGTRATTNRRTRPRGQSAAPLLCFQPTYQEGAFPSSELVATARRVRARMRSKSLSTQVLCSEKAN